MLHVHVACKSLQVTCCVYGNLCRAALIHVQIVGCMLPSPGQQVLLPAAAMGGLVMTRWGRRGLFGSAVSKEEEPAAAAAADASPLDLDIGGEGGYFDHDEVMLARCS